MKSKNMALGFTVLLISGFVACTTTEREIIYIVGSSNGSGGEGGSGGNGGVLDNVASSSETSSSAESSSSVSSTSSGPVMCSPWEKICKDENDNYVCVEGTIDNGCLGEKCEPCPDYNLTGLSKPYCNPNSAEKGCLYDCTDSQFANCDGDWSNGCEADLNSIEHCGNCDVNCADSDPNKHFDLQFPLCWYNSIPPNCKCAQDQNGTKWGDCNKDPGDGCEMELTNSANCGYCGKDCAEIAMKQAGGPLCMKKAGQNFYSCCTVDGTYCG